MGLTGKQKKYIKKNMKKKTVAEIATKLDVSAKTIEGYLKKRWGKKKYQNFLDAHEKRHLGGGVSGGISMELRGKRLWWNLGGEFNFRNWFRKNQKILALLTFLVFTVYFNSLSNDFVSDDIPAIVKNENLGNLSFVISQPLQFIRLFLYFITYKTIGLQPAFFRLINIFFHLGAVFAIYTIFNLIYTPLLAILTASIFAVHPILTESITWISGGGHAQYSFFFLLSFLLYILFLSQKNRQLLLASLLIFILALISSEKAVVLPAILTLFVFTFDNLKKHSKNLLSFWVVGAIFGLIFLSGLGQRVTELQTQFYQEPTTHNPLIQIPIAVTSYLKLIFLPKDLTLYHSEMSFTNTQYFLHLTVFIIFLALVVYGYKKNRHVFFWLCFFLISLLPTLTPFGVSWIVAERYVYLGSIGIFVVMAMFIQKVSVMVKNEKASYAILAILILALGARTIIRNRDWQNQDTLWLAATRTSPSSPQNHNNLGDLYGRRGDFEKAVEEFKRAIELKPGYADAYHNLGNTYQQMGKVDEAIENFEKAISFNPNLWQSYQNLAAIYFEQENWEKAEEYLQKAIEINPSLPQSILP